MRREPDLEKLYENMLLGNKTVKLTIKKDLEWGEYIVKVWINGKYDHDKSYFSGGLGPEEKQDALNTMEEMKKQFKQMGYTII